MLHPTCCCPQQTRVKLNRVFFPRWHTQDRSLDCRFTRPGGGSIHEKGLVPDIAVEQPALEFGQAAPTEDPVLEKALAAFEEKKAA